MANKRNINRVIASIKGEIKATEQIGFNMEDFVTDTSGDRSGRHCGTVACIAGHAHILKTKEDPKTCFFAAGRIVESGKEYLKLSYEDAEELFYANALQEDGQSLDDITPEQAIRTLEHLRDTGEVDWKA